MLPNCSSSGVLTPGWCAEKRRVETPLETSMRYSCAACGRGKDMKLRGMVQHEESPGHTKKLAQKLHELGGALRLEGCWHVHA